MTAAVGPPQRQHRVGQGRHRSAGLHAGGLSRLQPTRCARARLDHAHHRQADLLIAARRRRPALVVATYRAHPEHVDAAHGIAVDGGLIEAGQRAFGHHFFGAHQALRFCDRYAHGSRGYRSGRDSCLLLLNRTHKTPFSIAGPIVTCQHVDQAQSLHQPAPQVGAVVITVQCKVNRSLEVATGISQVVSVTAMHYDVHGMALVDQQRDRVGQLDLAARPARHPPQRIEDLAVQDVPAGRGIQRRRVLGLGLLHHALDS